MKQTAFNLGVKLSLTESDIEHLIRLCEREIGYCGIYQPAGLEAVAMREKLQGMLPLKSAHAADLQDGSKPVDVLTM